MTFVCTHRMSLNGRTILPGRYAAHPVPNRKWSIAPKNDPASAWHVNFQQALACGYFVREVY